MPDYVQEACINTSASQESVLVLYELKSGVATPLKIEFTPEKPFYPMKMTSINQGDVIANVYLFSNAPMTDLSGLMEVEKMTTVNSNTQEYLNLTGQNYVTSLTYTGKTSQLVTDSVFEPVYYDCAKDPRCETADVILARFAGGLLLGVMFLIVGWWFFTPAIAGFLVGWKYCRGKPWKHRILFFLALLAVIMVAVTLFFALIRSLGFLAQGFAIFLPMAALAYFPATMKEWKEWKAILAIIIILVLSIAVLFTIFPPFGIYF
jgi:hypothetical protein